MSPSPGSVPAEQPAAEPAAPPGPTDAATSAAPAWHHLLTALLTALLASLALAGLGIAAVTLAEHWSLKAEAALGLGLASLLVITGLATRQLRIRCLTQPTASAQRPDSTSSLPGSIDSHETACVLLQKQGDTWQVRALNSAARLAGAPTEGLSATQWLAQQDPAVAAAAAQDKESESFAYTVSHDLRAPIRVIEGFTRIVREDYGQALDRIGNDHLDRVLGAVARMNNMIDAMLALARLSSQPLVHQRVDLSRMAQYVLDDLHKHAPQRQVETRVTPGLGVDGDPTLMRLVLENLLGNAWKYSSRREVAHIEFGAEDREGQRTFYVSDDGAGFDMRFADRLFGPFQRLHSASEFQGTGVGLASVRRIVRRHQGEIWAEAQVDRGATFYFTLG